MNPGPGDLYREEKETYMPKKKKERKKEVKVRWDHHLTASYTIRPVS